jgi:restriction system protein
MDIVFHYPPELMNLLIDTIPRLCRSYEDTLQFFQGAGVEFALTADLWVRLKNDRKSLNKFKIARTVLTRLNQRGEATLRERREIVKRVTEWEDFSTCWESDRLEAQGLVSQIRNVVNVKDSFTRMKEERSKERQQHSSKREAEANAVRKRKEAIAQVKDALFALFREPDPRRRGKALEGVLNRLFAAYDILVREAFTLTGDGGEGVVEQIDGVIELDSHLYFVEVKWWQKPVGVDEISQHMMRVFLRAEARAIIVSASEFTAPAVVACKEALSQKVVTLCTLQEVVMLLERQSDLPAFLRRKIHATIVEKNPFPKVAIGD